MMVFRKIFKGEEHKGKESHNYIYEYLLYAALFGIALVFPFIRAWEMTLNGETFRWKYIFDAWLDLLPFLVLLVVHSVFLLPILLHKRNSWRYMACTFLLLCAFSTFTFFQAKRKFDRLPEPPVGMELVKPVPKFVPPQVGKVVPGPVIFNTIFAIMLLGCNLAVRLMFKQYWDMRKMEELEKIQISPHFFMNSLNNIHGMVEMDPVKAQEMILELSGMMKYVLYESSSHKIFLSKEVDFIANYVALMRVRYTPNKVSIKLDLPDSESCADIMIPPLLFINFLENAFKHGVDYRGNSFVEIALSVEDDAIVFRCCNSRYKNEKPDTNCGIGLANIRKRLDILYAGRYFLDMDEQENSYNITLKIQA